MKKGFTLAEVLITLSVIGVIAAVTIPSVITNIKTKQYSTAKAAFDSKFTQVLQLMHISGELEGLSSTEQFEQNLEKHFKVIKKCDNQNLIKCFANNIKYDNKLYDIKKMRNSKDLGKSYSTALMAVVIADGTNILFAYNPECKGGIKTQDECLAMVYDINGLKKPNSYSNDIYFKNAVLAEPDPKYLNCGPDVWDYNRNPVCSYNGVNSGEGGSGMDYYCDCNYYGGDVHCECYAYGGGDGGN